ncbi:hypothetical protein CEXT_681171 [Caerostris extrusa]|uniref:Uncharacterized protein n=1 Tax=Caerostris extrusa TaxID=172846 RepID=A0AAV4RC96_CAEEX|nr:hypothetical protein CEXT_681171 [Caerostris extrusa]
MGVSNDDDKLQMQVIYEVRKLQMQVGMSAPPEEKECDRGIIWQIKGQGCTFPVIELETNIECSIECEVQRLEARSLIELVQTRSSA